MDALALLRLQIEWGADEALDDAPVDRLRAVRPGQREGLGQVPGQGAGPGAGQGQGLPLPLREGVGGRGWSEVAPINPPPPAPPSTGGRVSGRATPPGHAPTVAPATSGTPAQRAAAAAGQARSVDDLHAALAAFDGCALRDTAANLVFAAGDHDAALMLIGEPPGEAEDRSGAPFAGAEGVLLDRMLASVGLARDSLLLTPLIPWRPPGGRLPSAAEIAVCLPFLHRLVALVMPSRIVLAGGLAARALLGSTRRRAATWLDLPVPGLPASIPALLMPSPGMVAKTPSARREAWAALRLLRRTLDADLAKT